MVGLGSLSRSLVSKQNEKKGSVILIPLTAEGEPTVNGFVLQYFPETVTDSLSVNYQAKDIPGAGGPLYQYVNTGARTLTFVATFTSDLDLGSESGRDAATGDHYRRNVDIRTAVAGLRRYMLPAYSGGIVYPPQKLFLYIPNSGIGMAGGGSSGNPDTVICIMTQCDVTWEAYFPSGHPRVASVSLQFTQISQKGGVVLFPSYTKEMYEYIDTPSESTVPYRIRHNSKKGGNIL